MSLQLLSKLCSNTIVAFNFDRLSAGSVCERVPVQPCGLAFILDGTKYGFNWLLIEYVDPFQTATGSERVSNCLSETYFHLVIRLHYEVKKQAFETNCFFFYLENLT